jgi:hypothetical protein
MSHRLNRPTRPQSSCSACFRLFWASAAYLPRITRWPPFFMPPDLRRAGNGACRNAPPPVKVSRGLLHGNSFSIADRDGATGKRDAPVQIVDDWLEKERSRECNLVPKGSADAATR